MIELYTGLPRSSKSLNLVERLYKLQKRWETNPDEARSVFSNIKDLKLVHQAIPTRPFQSNKNSPFRNVPDWEAMPEGSIVIIDEVQDYFPPRSTQSEAPPHVSWLNTHGHSGFDIWFCTQQPKLIDGAVRALVGRHLHHRRIFGMNRSIVYEWDGCSDSLSGTQTAVKSYYKFNKAIYPLYKSATLHQKQSFKKPLWLFIPVVGVVLAIFFIPRAYGVLSNGMSGKGIKGEELKTALPAAAKPAEKVVEAPKFALLPPAAAPVSEVLPQRPEELLISACIASKTRCQCYDSHGIKIPLSDEDCRENAKSVSLKFKLDAPRNDYPKFASR